MALPDGMGRDPRICGGEPVFRGTRVTVRTVVASLAEGDSVDDILQAFPTLTRERVEAARALAAERTSQA